MNEGLIEKGYIKTEQGLMILDMTLEDTTKRDITEMALIKMDMMYLGLTKKDIKLMVEMLTENIIDYMINKVILKIDTIEKVF